MDLFYTVSKGRSQIQGLSVNSPTKRWLAGFTQMPDGFLLNTNYLQSSFSIGKLCGLTTDFYKYLDDIQIRSTSPVVAIVVIGQR